MNGLRAGAILGSLCICVIFVTSLRAQQPSSNESSESILQIDVETLNPSDATGSVDKGQADDDAPDANPAASPQSPVPQTEGPQSTDSGSAAASPVVPPSLTSPPPSPGPQANAPSDNMLSSLFQRSQSRTRGLQNRLARTPEFFGDNFVGGDSIVDTGLAFVRSDLPLAASSRRAKIADHNKAYPVDRAFINYHHFDSAQNSTRGGVVTENNVDRFTIGFEKTFCCGQSSIEVRLPFAERFTLDDPDYRLVGGNVGNLAVIYKQLIRQTRNRAVAAGIGLDTPTGSDVRGNLPLQGVDFKVSNDSVHLLPYIGVVGAPGNLFYHGFLQLDVPINGNAIEVDNGTTIEQAILDETSYFYLDMSAGYWLFRDNCRNGRGLTGLAGVLEYHLTSTLGDGDFVSLAGGITSFGVPRDLGISNVTVGLHAEFDYYTKLRIGGAFPLSEEPHRFFDGEFMLSLIRHF